MTSNMMNGNQPRPSPSHVGFPSVGGPGFPGSPMSPLTNPSTSRARPGSPLKPGSPKKGSNSPIRHHTPTLSSSNNLMAAIGSPPQLNVPSPSRQRIDISSLANSQPGPSQPGPSSLLTTAPPTSQSPLTSQYPAMSQAQPNSQIPETSQVNGITSTQSSGSGSATVQGQAEGQEDVSMEMGEMVGDYDDNDMEEENVEAGDEEDDEGEEEEEDEEEDDEDSDGDDKSEDLEGGENDFEIIGDNLEKREGEAVVKTEGGEAPEGSTTTGAEGETTNVLVPKKRVRRARSEDDLPPPPPPMRTIRLERTLVLGEAEPLQWNILDEARDKGMVEDWTKDDDDADGMDVDGDVAPMPGSESAAPASVGLGLGLDDGISAGPSGTSSAGGGLLGLDGDAEEIARRLEEKYGGASKKPKPKKKKVVVENYDFEDDFIDDSELTIDAPTHIARPKKEGFFVQAGPLELLEEEAPRRPARTAPRRPKTGPVASAAPRPSLSSLVAALPHHLSRGFGTMASPIQIDSDDEGGEAGPSKPAEQTRKSPTPFPEVSMEPVVIDRALFTKASKDPQFLPPFPTFPNEVRYRLMELREMSNKHTWQSERSKFPDHLRDPLRVVCRATFKYDMFGTRDDRLFQALPSILPYNQFTLMKLAFRTCMDQYWAWLEECEDEGVKEMAKLVETIKESEFEKYEKAISKWKEDVVEWDSKHPNGVDLVNGNTPVLPSSDPTAVDAEGEEPAQKLDDKPREPPRRFYFSPEMKELFRQLLDNCQEMSSFCEKARVDLKMQDVKSSSESSEKVVRAKLYRKMTAVFPEGFMSPPELSREMTRVKGRGSRQQQRANADDK